MLPLIESTDGDYPKFSSGFADGSNKEFVCQWGFAPHTQPKVFMNGVLQSPGLGEDYLIKWSEIGKIEFITAPTNGSKITIEFWAIGDNS